MRIASKLSHVVALGLLFVIRVYQLFISPLLGQNCRFHPTCSCYAHQALARHGAVKGSMLAIKRIVKCQPLHPGGIDHVPPRDKKTLIKCNTHSNNATPSIKNNKINKSVSNSALKDTINKPTF